MCQGGKNKPCTGRQTDMQELGKSQICNAAHSFELCRFGFRAADRSSLSCGWSLSG
jgi:hypothetical protein